MWKLALIPNILYNLREIKHENHIPIRNPKYVEKIVLIFISLFDNF